MQALALALTVAGVIWLALSVAGKADSASEKADLNSETITAVQESREISVFATCKDLQIVIRTAAQLRGHARDGEAFLKRIGLENCRQHAQSLTALP